VTLNPSARDETEQERLDRELEQLLHELRVAMPGVQVLFAFLLTVPFQQRFAGVTEFQKASTSSRCWRPRPPRRCSSRRRLTTGSCSVRATSRASS